MEVGTFVAFCHFLSDLFSSISNFSLQLQKNDVILPQVKKREKGGPGDYFYIPLNMFLILRIQLSSQAVSGIESLLATIEAMAASPKPDGKLSEFLAAMKKQRQQRGGEPGTGTFKYQEVTLSKGEAAELAEEENTKDIPAAKAVKCFNVFSHDSWPDNRLELLNHGVEEVNFLLQHFSTVLDRNGCSKEKAKEEFQLMKMTINTSFKDKNYLGLWQVMTTKEPYCSDFAVGSVICSIKNDMIIVTVDLNILHLVKIMLVLPISSAVCERGFASVNRIKSDVRASLHTDTVEDLIRISVEGPQLEDYDARQDVKQWFSQGKRSRRPNYMSWPLE
ncbi:Zinc finger protein 862 [Merluccius polli]|uniref:Zinc finger protein 862 n=1 Tax=Merluccius polli TaxID=89951 RepID=A0AA47M8C6_MERPO|nr:Zinc finger protein 862 [Merluccius polli]